MGEQTISVRRRRTLRSNPRGRVLFLALGLAACLVPAAALAQADDFTVIAMPDTQFYTCTSGGSCASGFGIFASQTDWISLNRDLLDIRFVTQLGDCAQNGNVTAEYDIAEAAFMTIEAAVGPGYPDGIPYGIAVGNHDQFPIANPGSIPNAGDVNHPDQGTTTTTYNSYFGVDRFCPASICRDYYGDHFGINNDNHYQLFSANGYDFIIVHIEYMATDSPLRQAVIAWADGVLQTYSDRRAIVVSHYVLGTGNPASFSNQGQALYDGLKANPNLFLILGGHIEGEGRRTDTFNGNTVHTLLSDYQGRTNGGNGWLRILEFRPADNQLAISTYSPFLSSYEMDADSEFTLAYDMGSGYPGAQTETESFQQGSAGYAGAVDTHIASDSSTTDHGADDHMFWDGSPHKQTFLRFDGIFDSQGGPVPAGVPITSATLTYVADDNGNDAEVHELLFPFGDDILYTDFAVGDPGADPETDYDATVVAVASGVAPGGTPTEHTVDVTASLSAWSADPNSMYGWILVPTGGSGTGVRTSEYGTVADRPKLTVSYLANPCVVDGDCADASVCTADACIGGFCQNATIGGCCEIDADCNDANVCTTDSCNLGTNTCENVPDPGCCASDTDCDDLDSCTLDSCVQPNVAALVLDGSGDWVDFGDDSTHTELGLQQFTLETWFRRTGTGDTVSTGTGGVVAVPLVAKGRGEADGNNRDANYFLGISDADGGVLAADFEDTGGSPNNHPVLGSTPIANGVWYHAAVTFDGADLRLYLNGSPDGTAAAGATPRFDSIQPFTIGTAMNSSQAADGAFQGELDEVRVWDRALSMGEIQANMNQPVTSDPDLVGRWGMDEGSGSTAFDSVNGNDGTLVADATYTTSGLVSMGTGQCQSDPDPTCCAVDTDCDDADFCTVDACHIVPGAGVLEFDGASDHVTVDDALAAPSLGSNSFTLEAWILWDGGGATASSGSGGVVGVPIVTKGRGEADAGDDRDANYFLAIEDGSDVLAADFEAFGDSSNHPVFGVTPITTGVWHHVAASFGSGVWSLYLDGNLEATSASGATPRGDSIQHFGIGAAFNSTGVAAGSFDGLIHDVRVWDHVRSEAEIQAGMTQTLSVAPGLLGSFPLDEGMGTVAGDATGLGNDAAIVGASWTMETDACVAGPSLCEMAMFQQGVDGYGGTVDSYIEVSTGAHGGEDHLFWDGSPDKAGLLRFEDLFDVEGGPIPMGAMISEAWVSYVADDNGNPADVHEAVIAWDGSTTHAGFGGAPGAQSGDDYAPAAVGVASGDAPDAPAGTAHEVDVTASLVAWASNPGANLGWVFVPTGSSGTGVRTSEHATVSDRPKLVVSYLPPECSVDLDCEDGDPCTSEACVDFACVDTTPALCDINGSGSVDVVDIDLITDARNTPAGACEPRDVDQDGTITVFDASICTLECDLPECSPVCGLLGIEGLLPIAVLSAWRRSRRRRAAEAS